MRKKYHTLAEVREAAAERARRWREKNKVLARERVAHTYGRAKYPQMVEANRRKHLDEAERRTDGVERTAAGDRQGDLASGETPEREGVVHGDRSRAGEVEGRGGGIGEGELIRGPIEGWDTPSREYQERMKTFERRKARKVAPCGTAMDQGPTAQQGMPSTGGNHPSLKGVGETSGSIPQSEEERRVQEWIKNKTRRGVEVEICL